MKGSAFSQEISQSYLLRDDEVGRDDEDNTTTPLSHPTNPSNTDF